MADQPAWSLGPPAAVQRNIAYSPFSTLQDVHRVRDQPLHDAATASFSRLPKVASSPGGAFQQRAQSVCSKGLYVSSSGLPQNPPPMRFTQVFTRAQASQLPGRQAWTRKPVPFRSAIITDEPLHHGEPKPKVVPLGQRPCWPGPGFVWDGRNWLRAESRLPQPAYNGTVAGLNSGTGDRALDRYIPDWLVHHHHA